MKKKLLFWCATGLLVALTRSQAATLYVDAASTNAVPPFTNWNTAAVTIQDAVDASDVGDEIVVTNGVYQTGARAVSGMSNRVAVIKPVTVRSVNGPEVTSIIGAGPVGATAIRCVYLTNGAVLMGFTLTNGGTQSVDGWEVISITNSGGGVWCESQSALITNCVLVGNSAYFSGGGACFATLNNCVLMGNSAGQYGGGSYDGTLNNCTLTNNSVWAGPVLTEGGGACYGTLNNCTLTGNSATEGGGAIWATLNNCILMQNNASWMGGGTLWSTLNNCTVMGNSAGTGGGAAYTFLNNCIVCYNRADYGTPNNDANILNYSCTTPDPGSGVGNITNAPLFVDTNGWSNLRLQSNSPCINAGNNSYLTDSNFTNSFDLDGNPRLVGGTVDMGAYEFQSPASMISYAWLQQFGLPTDGSADYADPDHDGHNNWQEWMAGTDPTNARSVLRLAAPVITPTNVTLTWTSVTNRTYTLEQATNLGGAPAFSVLSSNLVGLPGTTSWTDTNAPVSSPRFYQLRVGP